MNTPINFELAKLLKEKGFDNPCENRYNELGELTATKLGMNMQPNNYSDSYSAPTIAEVCMWLYEKHGIWIVILPELLNGTEIRYYPSVFEQGVGEDVESYFNSPTEAFEDYFELIKESNLMFGCVRGDSYIYPINKK